LVYERMQKEAGQARDTHAQSAAQAERRLAEDYSGVTEEARAELERQRQEHLPAFRTPGAGQPPLLACREAMRQGRAWTVEWENKQAQRLQHEKKQPEIEAARREAEAAQRAAGVVPLLDQADLADKEHRRRQEALRRATAAHARCLVEHQT